MEQNKAMQAIGSVATYLFIMVSAVIINGWGLSVLWGWFVAEQFGIMSISVAQGCGVMGIVSLVRTKSTKVEEDEKGIGGMFKKLIFTALLTAFTVGIGWIIHLFV